MFKIFEWIGSVIAILCLLEIAHNPKQVLRDIQNGPMPHLAQFNDQLFHPKPLKEIKKRNHHD